MLGKKRDQSKTGGIGKDRIELRQSLKRGRREPLLADRKNILLACAYFVFHIG